MWFTKLREFMLRMVIRGVLLFVLFNWQLVAGVDDGVQLQSKFALTCVEFNSTSNAIASTQCDDANLYQKWQWMNGKMLRNLGADKCLEMFAGSPRLRARTCDVEVRQQRFTCCFNTINGAKTNQGTNIIGLYVNNVVTPVFERYGNVRTRWKKYGGKVGDSICTAANFRDHSKWWRLAGGMRNVDTGLNRWIIATNDDDKIFILDSTGRRQSVNGDLLSASVGPQGLWGVNAASDLYYTPSPMEVSWHASVSLLWEFMGSGYGMVDFKMPGKGFAVKQDNQFCARLGISDATPRGIGWQCVPLVTDVSHLSCGVTGCFIITDKTVHFRAEITDANPTGTEWIPLENPTLTKLVNVAAGPIYELWAISNKWVVFRRAGIDDENPKGIKWERVPGLMLKSVSIGIFGPIGITSEHNQVVILNGSPTPKRQRELDELCEAISQCSALLTGMCRTSGDQCHARYSHQNDLLFDNQWRCHTQESLLRDGQIRDKNSPCFYTRDAQLKPIVFKAPVLGDFTKQMWLDQACNDPLYNPNLSVCLAPYYAYDDNANGSLVCRSVAPSNTCPTVGGLHDVLFQFTRASCGDIPLGSSNGVLPDSAFWATSASDDRLAHNARLTGGSAWCTHSSNVQNEFLELEFGLLYKICAIATRAFDSKFVTSYKLQYSSDYVLWKYSSIFGTAKEFKGSESNTIIEKHYLPTVIEARFLRLRPVAVSTLEFCLKIEVYGHSKETEADSCEYYRTRLYATEDGFYNIYSNESETKKVVFCLGLDNNVTATDVPIDENDVKLFWPLNSTQQGDTLLTIHGRTGVEVFQINQSKILGNFHGWCVSNPNLCDDGLTVEIWLWFKCTTSGGKTVVIQSGSEHSRGFTLYIKNLHVCFEVRDDWSIWKTCVGELGNGNRWLHVAASWSHVAGLALIVDDPARRDVSNATHWSTPLDDFDSLLRLGSPALDPDQNCSVVVNSLSISLRQFSDDKLNGLFRDDYLLSDMGESCSSACLRKGRRCYPVMDTNITAAFEDLGIRCPSGSVIGGSQPLVRDTGLCAGLTGLPDKICCDCQGDEYRRLCRCEQPVHGSFTEWSNWSFCSRTCGSGRRIRSRSCTNPSPLYGGNVCEGPSTMMEECHKPSCNDVRGVLREIWLGSDTDFQNIAALQEHPTFPSHPTYIDSLEAFETSTSRTHYGQRLRAYFRPPSSGLYEFIMSCSHHCVLWLSKGADMKKKIVSLSLPTAHNKNYRMWDESTTKSSIQQHLDNTKIYHLEALHVHYSGSGYFGVGYKLSTGETQIPITSSHLVWRFQDPQGISRELWKTYSAAINNINNFQTYIKNHFPKPMYQDTIGDFETNELGEYYGQRLRTFFLAPSSGTYAFYMYCNSVCTLWFSNDANPQSKTKLLELQTFLSWGQRWTLAQAKSVSRDLEGGKFYYLEALHIELTAMDYFGVGVTLPNGTSLQPISKKYLWQRIPGNLAFGRPAFQAQPAHPNWWATNAVDGHLGSCTHTEWLHDPWLRLNMVDSVTVRTVVVTNRNGFQERLDNFVIRVGSSLIHNGDLNPKCSGPNSIPESLTNSFPCINEVSGRYLTIHIYGPSRVLTVCELVVYGFLEVPDGFYSHGLSDGRIEDYQLVALPSVSVQNTQFQDGRLFHPFKSWCGGTDLPIRLEIKFKEQKDINSVATQGHPWKERWVTKYSLSIETGSGWVKGWDTTGSKEFSGNYDANTVVINTLNRIVRTEYVKFFPLLWNESPCVRLEFYGKDWDNEFIWLRGMLRDTLTFEFSGNETQRTEPVNSVLFNTLSHLKLFGLNTPCLISPNHCLRDFKIYIIISVKDPTVEGSILTTSNFSTSAVGSFVFLKNQQIVVLVQTETRVWRASGPVTRAVNTFCPVLIIWSKEYSLKLKIGSDTFIGVMSYAKHVNTYEEGFSQVLKIGGGLDFSASYIKIYFTEINEERKRKRLFAVDGFYSEWTPWSYCSKSCGNNGVERRTRKCDNPAKAFRGGGCWRSQEETRPCPRPSCEDSDGVLREVWLNKSSLLFSLKNVFDNYSSHVEVVPSFSHINDGHHLFAERLRAFLFANRTGLFLFQLTCSFQCELWISSSDEADQKEKLLSIDESNQAGPLRSVTGNFHFTLGEHYYIEVKSFEVQDGRNHSVLTITPPNSESLGEDNGYSLVRHKPDCLHGLGMESGAIGDEQISSSVFSNSHDVSTFGRLNSHNPWCKRERYDSVIYIDLLELHWVAGVAVQGYNKENWVSVLLIGRYLARDWPQLAGLENQLRFDGNEDGESTKIIHFPQPLRVKVISVLTYKASMVGLGCLRLEIIGCHAGNLALGKHTQQSAVYRSRESFYAADGIFKRHGLWYCAIATGSNPFWSIDLGKSFYISEIIIVQRKDCCRERFHDFEVRIGNANETASGVLNPRCGGLYSMAPALHSLVIPCKPYSYGRFLTIAKPGPTSLTICEVAIFQIDNDTITGNWSECSVTCGEGIQYRQPLCIKPYYCKVARETRPCAERPCKIHMQNCRQLQLQGYSQSGPYLVKPNPELESTTWVYCDQALERGGWLVIQRRYEGTFDFDQPWEAYKNGFGNISTEFWIGNKNLHQLTKGVVVYKFLLLLKYSGGTIRKTECDLFNVSSETNHYQLRLGRCHGADARNLSYSNLTEFSTRDADHGLSALNCDGDLNGGWWYGSCGALQINSELSPCFTQGSCSYETTMMIRPHKVVGGWSHWTSWATCDKPCGGGNITRVRFCTHPPPGDDGIYCKGHWNESRGCNEHPCIDVELNITLRFTAESWDEDLVDPMSALYQDLFEKISANVKALYDNDPSVNVFVQSFRPGSIMADISINFDSIDEQQLIILQEDLDQDGLLNQDMPVEYNYNNISISQVPFEPPVIIEITNTSSTSFFVKWTPSNTTSVQASLLGYRIYYKKLEDVSLVMLAKSVGGNVFETEITDLEIFTSYTVRISAFSSSGNGLPTVAYYVKTDEEVPSQAPVITSATNVSSTSLFIEWQIVNISFFRGNPLGYTLYYKVKSTNNNTAFLNASLDDYQTTNTSIYNLMKYTMYEVLMVARTKKGKGVPGELMNFMTDEDVPSQPPGNTNVENKTSSSLQISWSSIPNEWTHGILRGYLITYWPLDFANETKNTTTDAHITEVKLEGLRKFTNYSIRVAGMTSKGIGNLSEITVETSEDVPSRGPYNLLGFSVSATAINISWSPIPQQYVHGILRGYIVYYNDNLRHSGNVSLPVSQTQRVLDQLLSYTLYSISVVGFTKVGNGPRTSVLVWTDKGAPSREPWDLTCPSESSYTISLQWFPFNSRTSGGSHTGYVISYKMVVPPDPKVVNITLPPLHTYTLEGLRGFSQYSIEMFVYNPLGRSNTSTVLCFTEEGKPLAAPTNVKASSNIGSDKILVTWEHVPNILVSGIRRGYTITYQKVKNVGDPVQEIEQKLDLFQPNQSEVVLQGLDPYSEYEIAVRVFNSRLSGDPSDLVYAETCRCLPDFYVNWCSYTPYANTSDSGIFPPLVRDMIEAVCGNCSEHTVRIHFDRDARGHVAKKSTLMGVKQSIGDKNQLSFPVLGRKAAKYFLPVIYSPGSVFVTKKPKASLVVSYAFLETVISTLPLLGFSVITASLAGIVMWCLESKRNEDHFPRSFRSGASEGFWWSFITMTTVGYGDRAPITIPGRLFALAWTLYGLVITGLLIGNLTAALTVTVALTVSDVDLYQSNIAVIENSSEYRLGMAKGAFVNRGRNYSNIISILHAVEVSLVDGALLDMYVVASLHELQREDSPLMVKTIIANPSSYGIALSGHAKNLQNPLLLYFRNNAAFVSRMLEKNTRPVEEKEHDADTEQNEDDSDSEINVLAPNSPLIKPPLIYSSVFIAAVTVIGLILHFTLCKRRRKSTGLNTVLPVSDLAEQQLVMKTFLNGFCDDLKGKIKELKRKQKGELLKMGDLRTSGHPTITMIPC